MKEKTTSEYIHSLITQGEHQQQDFKFEISDVRKIARSLSAFANTDGGRLLIGVKDNGKIAGVRSEEEGYMIEAAAQLYCQPPVACTLQSYVVEGKTVLIADIPASDQRPVYAIDENQKRWAYIRIKDENILATPVHLQIWKQSSRPTGELLQFTDREKRLFQLLEANECLSINRCCRLARISRPVVERLLAKFIRYEVVEPVFREHQFYFRLRK